jgi:hypothetical protein
MHRQRDDRLVGQKRGDGRQRLTHRRRLVRRMRMRPLRRGVHGYGRAPAAQKPGEDGSEQKGRSGDQARPAETWPGRHTIRAGLETD